MSTFTIGYPEQLTNGKSSNRIVVGLLSLSCIYACLMLAVLKGPDLLYPESGARTGRNLLSATIKQSTNFGGTKVDWETSLKYKGQAAGFKSASEKPYLLSDKMAEYPKKVGNGTDAKIVGMMKFSICCGVEDRTLQDNHQALKKIIWDLGRNTQTYRTVIAGRSDGIELHDILPAETQSLHLPNGKDSELKVLLLEIAIANLNVEYVQAFENGLWLERHQEVERQIQNLITEKEDKQNKESISVSWVARGVYPYVPQGSATGLSSANSQLVDLMFDHERALKDQLNNLAMERSEGVRDLDNTGEEIAQLKHFVHIPDSLYPLALQFATNARIIMGETILQQQMLKQRRIENAHRLEIIKSKQSELEKSVKQIDDEVDRAKKTRDDAVQSYRQAEKNLIQRKLEIREVHQAILDDSERMGRYVRLIQTYIQMLGDKYRHTKAYNASRYDRIVEQLRGTSKKKTTAAQPIVLHAKAEYGPHELSCHDSFHSVSCGRVYSCVASNWEGIQYDRDYVPRLTFHARFQGEAKGARLHGAFATSCGGAVPGNNSIGTYYVQQIHCSQGNTECNHVADVHPAISGRKVPSAVCMYLSCDNTTSKAFPIEFEVSARLIEMKPRSTTRAPESSPAPILNSLMANVWALLFTAATLLLSIYFVVTS